MKICARCHKEKDESKFYQCAKNNGSLYSYCNICAREQTAIRKREYKKRIVDYFGGKCEICGYDKCIGALEFHHKNPNTKENVFSNVMRNLSFEKQKEVTVGCILLCANCHREIHEKNKMPLTETTF